MILKRWVEQGCLEREITQGGSMKFYLAPMEGITGYVYRNAYYKYFGHMDCYFTPFIGNKRMAAREQHDVDPKRNLARPLVPQILTNRAEDFLLLAGQLLRLGYDEVNLNLGCPSGTVAARGRGAGFLGYPKELDAFLCEIFDKCPLKISIKTRIGVNAPGEWPGLLEIYKKYPISELIIHPRLQRDFYKNSPNWEAYGQAVRELSLPLCYNGDIASIQDFQGLMDAFPHTECVMLGRGILRSPWLAGRIKESMGMTENKGVDRDALLGFHEELLSGYQREMEGERNVLFRLKELWSYMGDGFAGAEKLLKKIKKSSRLPEYRAAAEEIIRSCQIRDMDTADAINLEK